MTVKYQENIESKTFLKWKLDLYVFFLKSKIMTIWSVKNFDQQIGEMFGLNSR